ncbi:MAG TPA: geranylgeranylglycerol-phosphate geranylgeranyltransferase [Bacteroidia bacterium]|nr:geranylgeranylglycerol-phosphate geranylgeranyltransferase [Bacteroidia bacterium]
MTNSFLKLIRFPNLLIIAFTQYMVRWCLLFPILKAKGVELQMSNLYFFLLVISTVMIAAAGYIINDYFDGKIDRINKPDAVVVGTKIKRRVAMAAHAILNILGIAIGLFVSYKIGDYRLGFIFIFCAGGLWFYSTTFKYQFFIGNFIVALFTACIPLMAGGYELLMDFKKYIPQGIQLADFKDVWHWILGLSAFAFITTFLREIIKDMEDIKGDKEYGCNTIPIAWGINAAKTISLLILLFCMLAIGYIQKMQHISNDYFSFYYFLIALQIPFLFLGFKLLFAKEKKQFHYLGNVLKLIMLLGISYLFVFCFILLSAVNAN